MAHKLLEAAESIKKNADLLFGRGNFEAAIEKYSSALESLIKLRGAPFGEDCASRCFANQAQCFIKVEKFEEALRAVNIAISIPSSNSDLHMYSKLWFRRAKCLEGLGNLPQALFSVDRAIGILSSSEFVQYREKLIENITTKHGIVAIPDLPQTITPEEVEAAVTFILQKGGQPNEIVAKIEELVGKRGNIDAFDAKGNNIMFAVCQAAVMRAGFQSSREKGRKKKERRVGSTSSGSETEYSGTDSASELNIKSDDVLPLLELIVKKGFARAEQRFVSQGNRTPLQMLSVAGAAKCVSFLISAGATAFVFDDKGWSPLLVAVTPNGPCSGANSAVVKVLLENKAVVNQTNEEGMHALSLACQAGDVESVKLILMHGGRINQRCRVGFSPVIWTRLGCRKPQNAQKIVSVLLEAAKGEGNTNNIVLREMQEDLKCCDTSLVLFNLEVIRSKRLQEIKSECEAEQKDPDYSGEGKILIDAMMRMLKIPTSFNTSITDYVIQDVTNEDKFTSIAEMAFMHFLSILPGIFHKQWRLKPLCVNPDALTAEIDGSSSEDLGSLSPQEAVGKLLNKSLEFEKIWLNVLLTAASGPDKTKSSPLVDVIPHFHYRDGKLPSGETFNSIFFQNRFYLNYINCVENPLTQEFSSVIPLCYAVDFIVNRYRKVCCLDRSRYWQHALNSYSVYRKHMLNENSEVLKGLDIAPEFDCSAIVTPSCSNIGELENLVLSAVNESVPSDTALVIVFDYTISKTEEEAEKLASFGKSLLDSYNGRDVVLFEVYFDNTDVVGLSSTGDAANNPYALSSGCYLRKHLEDASFESQLFQLSTVLSYSKRNVAESAQKPPAGEPLKFVRYPSWVYKRCEMSVWNKK